MIYETEPEHQGINLGGWQRNTVFITAQSYLKGLHWHDRPTELMPKDAVLLSKAKRFYESLSEYDQTVIDSFSDPSLLETMSIRQRNNRFNELCFTFMNIHILTTPPGEKKGRNQNEHDKQNSD